MPFQELWDTYPTVVSRVDDGVKSSKEFASVLGKIAQCEADFGKALNKVCKGAMKKQAFEIPAESETWYRAMAVLIRETETRAAAHVSLGERLSATAADTLMNFAKAEKDQVKQIKDNGKRELKYLADMENQLNKAREVYRKRSIKAESDAEAYDGANGDPDMTIEQALKLAAKAQKSTDRMHEADRSYQSLLYHFNDLQKRHYEAKFPDILDQLEGAERGRLSGLHSVLRTVADSYAPMVDHYTDYRDTVEEVVSNMEIEQDLEYFANTIRTDAPTPANRKYIAYEPTHTYEGTTLQRPGRSDSASGGKASGFKGRASKMFGRIRNRGDSSASEQADDDDDADIPTVANPLFGLSLQAIMKRQEKEPEFADHAVPRVLSVLTEKILANGGEQEEGIFRVPALADAIQELKAQLESGDYEILTNDPNIPAATLKLWLRELLTPLIPDKLYDRAIAAHKDTEGACAVIDELPAYNKAVVDHLMQFLMVMAQPHNVEVTLMSADNLAMVFAPSFLRCPSEDLNVVMANTEPEKLFVKTYLEWYIEDQGGVVDRSERGPVSPAGGTATAAGGGGDLIAVDSTAATTSTPGALSALGLAAGDGAPPPPAPAPAPAPSTTVTPTPGALPDLPPVPSNGGSAAMASFDDIGPTPPALPERPSDPVDLLTGQPLPPLPPTPGQ